MPTVITLKANRNRRWLLAVCLSVSGCDDAVSPLPMVGMLAHERLELVAQAPERILEILVTEGQVVEQGDVLLRQDADMANAHLAEARATNDRMVQQLAESVRGPRSQQIKAAQANHEGAEKHVVAQQREYDRISALVERRMSSSSDLDRALDLLQIAKSQRGESTARLAELLEGTTAEQLAQAQASVAETQARVSQLELTAQRLVVHAPRAGTIDALPFEVGEQPPQGATVVVMLTHAPAYARVYVPAAIRSLVLPGQMANINIDGFDQSLQGEVRYISADAAFTPYFALTQRDRSRLVYLAEVVITDAQVNRLPSGTPVEVDIPALR